MRDGPTYHQCASSRLNSTAAAPHSRPCPPCPPRGRLAYLFAGTIEVPFALALAAPAGTPGATQWDSWIAWACMIATAAVHSLYVLSLGLGYSLGGVSVVYPIARGTGVALAATLAPFVFARGIAGIGVAGIALIVVGITTIGLAPSGRRKEADMAASAAAGGSGIGSTAIGDAPAEGAAIEMATLASAGDPGARAQASATHLQPPSMMSGGVVVGEDGGAGADGAARAPLEADDVALVVAATGASAGAGEITTAPASSVSALDTSVGNQDPEPVACDAVDAAAAKAAVEAARIKRLDRRTILVAMCIGLCIGTYVLIDATGVQYVEPLTYSCVAALGRFTFSVPYLTLTERGRRETRLALAEHKRYIVAVGCGAVSTYLIILFAYQRAHASYVVALREFSVVIGSVLGYCLLKEPFHPVKGAGLVAVVAGMVLVKLAPRPDS